MYAVPCFLISVLFHKLLQTQFFQVLWSKKDWRAKVMEKNTFFTDLYSKQYNAQKLYAYRKLGDLDDAEDVVQEVFCTALEKIDMLLGSENPEAWLMQTLKYKVQNKLRENYKRISRVSNLSDSVQYGVEMKFECDEDEGRWEYCQQKLSQENYKLLKLVIVEEYTISEAAHELNLSKWVAQKRMQRLMKLLQETFKNKF